MYLIEFIDPGSGALSSMTVDAADEAEALQTSGLPRGVILSARKTVVAGFVRKLFEVRLAIRDQILFLSTLAAIALAGQRMDEGFKLLLSRRKALRKVQDKVMQHSTTSERLRALHFETEAVLLARVGEDSGKPAEGLARAADVLLRRSELMANMYKSIVMGCLVILVATVALLLVPLALEGALSQMLTIPELKIKKNILTFFLLGIAKFVKVAWFVPPIVLVVAFSLRKQVWTYIHKVPPFATFEEFMRLGMAVRFLSSMHPLYEAGIPTVEAITQMSREARPRDRRVWGELLVKLREGQSLSKAIDSDEWPDILRLGLSGFELATADVRVTMLAKNLELVHQRMRQLSGQIGGILAIAGTLLAVLTIMMLVVGGMYPIIGAKTA